ncbi:MAG: sugar ABC transporter permease [Clostridia bacterium]|nr:sugar ABC transporter permease [Clostridia bacterium]
MKISRKQEVAVISGNKTVWQRMLSQWQLYIFLLPALIFLAIFAYGPMYGILLAFKDYMPMKGIMGSPWVGFKHFTRFFTQPTCLQYIKNTVSISLVSTLLSVPIPIIFALMLDQVDTKWYKKLVQNMTYMPYMLSVVIVISICQVLLSPTSGVVNIVIEKLGGSRINFFGEEDAVFWIYWLTGVWQNTGYSAVIYLAALSGIDQEQLEAAKIDGASRLRIIWNIKLPAIANTVIIMMILAFGGAFNVGVDKMLLIQNSMNLGKSEVISTYVYKVGLLGGEYGFSTAINLFNTLVNVLCVLTVNKIADVVSDTSLF